jgi:hypothetical protein
MRFLIWRLRLAVSSWRGRGRRRRVIALSIGTALSAGLFFVARAMFRELNADAGVAHVAPLAVTAALHATFLFSLLRDTGGAMGHLFLSKDAGFLLASPLSPARVLSLKMVEAVADAVPAPVGTALPIILAYGAAVGAGPGFFLLVPAVFILLLMLTVEIGFLLAFLLAPLAPPGRLRHLLSASSTLLFLLCWLLLLWLARAPDTGLFDGLAGADSWLRMQELLGAVPSTWAAGELVGVAGGTSIGGTGLLRLVFLVGLLTSAVLLFSPRYPALWQMAQVARRRRPAGKETDARSSSRTAILVSPGRARPGSLVAAFLKRDVHLFGREPGMITDMGVLVVMSAFLPVLLAPAVADMPNGGALLLWAAVVFVSVELGYELGSRALPLERTASHWVFAAPLSAARLLATRAAALWLIGVPCVAAVAGVGCVGLGLGPAIFARAAALGGLLLAISLPVGLAAGVYLGRSDWRHPRQMLTLGGRMILLALLLVLAGGFWHTLQVDAVAQGGIDRPLGDDPLTWFWVVCGGAVVAGVCAWVAWRRLRCLEWLH